ncbi:RraA family protein [Intestinibacter sp.]|uniref:RraA family protein n=1 Tax=Intestinibacter sp. TaxID=1965304 RepID=UPI003F14A16A
MKEYIERLKKLDTTCVSDAMDKLGIPCALYGVKPVIPGHVICGEAFTIKYKPCGQVKGTVGDFLDDVKPGNVIVIDNDGRTDCTVWGDIMAYTAKKIGVEATLIDGVCRDLPAVKKCDYPIFSKGYYMSTGKDRVEIASINEEVSVSNIPVCPGDIILGDDTGAVVIPRNCVEKVIEIAEGIEKTEKLILAEIDKGSSLRDARAKLNYHHLQTKESK